MIPRAIEQQDLVGIHCPCGFIGSALLKHWEIARCRCNRLYWALQIHRGEKYQAFPWPGAFHK